MSLAVWDDVTLSATELAIFNMIQDAGFGDTLIPDLVVTSAKRNPGDEGYSSDYHNTSPFLAIDFGANSQQAKDDFAAWLLPFKSYLVELIHTNGADTDGWYVKNYTRVFKGFYGDATESAHINHVHLAMYVSDVARMRSDPRYVAAANAYKEVLKSREVYWYVSDVAQ